MTKTYNWNRATRHKYDDTSTRFVDTPLPVARKTASQATYEEELRALQEKHPHLLANRFA